MITLAMIKPIGGVLKRLDVKALAEQLKTLDAEKIASLPEEGSDGYEAAKAAHDEEAGKLGEILIVALAEKLEDVADDVVRLCAAYKDVDEAEAMKLDAFATIKEIVQEAGFKDFFKSAVSSAMKK